MYLLEKHDVHPTLTDILMEAAMDANERMLSQVYCCLFVCLLPR